jgi:hypothetical protein
MGNDWHKRQIFALIVLLAHIVVPLVDSVACSDCRGSVPFSGGVEISHMNLTHVDVNPVVGHSCDTNNKAADEEDSKIFCSLCGNVIYRAAISHSEPLAAVESLIDQHFLSLPAEPSGNITKPPQNLLAS